MKEYTLNEIVESFINGNITWSCEEVKKLNNIDLIKLLKCYSANRNEEE